MWKGTNQSSDLHGNIHVLEGKYTKNFDIIEQLTKKEQLELKRRRNIEKSRYKNVMFDLKIDGMGDFFIKNNLGDIELKAMLVLTGNAERPRVDGSVETIYGTLHYMGISFNITQGFIDFNENESDNPYMEITGEEEISSYTVTAKVFGNLKNLQVDLSAVGSETGVLDKQDTISLITFGMTQREMQQYSSSRNTRMASTIIAEQVSQVIERPLTKLTRLDVFRVGAGDRRAGEQATDANISQLLLGKQITDRLSLNFATDVDIENAEQTITAEYKLTDFLVLKGLRGNNRRYGFNISLQFLTD
jgi:autotransporter translocation and assembly factor TamB